MVHGPSLTRLGSCLAVVALVATASPSPTSAAVPKPAAPTTMTLGDHLKTLARYGQNYLERMRPEVVERLSAGGQLLVKLGQDPGAIENRAVRAQSAMARLGQHPQGPRAAPAGLANDAFAAEDFLSRVAGMTQSETTVGWCGSNALIGFNDSGSVVSTAFLAEGPSGSLSFNGWSQSTNAGSSYTDRGALLADPIPADLLSRDLLGDPVIGCSGPSTFYYSSLAMDTGAGGAFANSDVTVSRSIDGGTTFQAAVPVAAKDARTHFLDKPWMAVEPGPTSSPADDVLQVTYTDFELSGFDGSGPCPGDIRTAIEHVRSTDGGRTWTRPQVLDELCGAQGSVQGSQVEAGVGDDVHVAWERYPSTGGGMRELLIRGSTDLGATFAAGTSVAKVTPIGDSTVLQGQFRTDIALQGLAVDRSNGPRRGAVYMTYHDGGARQKPDPLGLCLDTATYCFGDVYLTSSTNAGTSWSAPVRINNDDPQLGVDQWFPAVDVDRSGAVWTAYYDRRRDTRNFLIDTFVARSTNGGATWANARANGTNFAPVTGSEDLLVNPAYMADYIAIAVDATGRFPGAIAAWGDNALGDANVAQRRFEEVRP